MSPKGSHATYGGWEAKTCGGCGVKVVLSRGHWAFHFDHVTKTASTLCGNCLLLSRVTRNAT